MHPRAYYYTATNGHALTDSPIGERLRARQAIPQGSRLPQCWRLALVAVFGAIGCGTTRVSDTQRTATEQLLVSNAIDQAVSQLDFRILAGKQVYFDAQYLSGSVDRGYVVSSLRQHLLACGCILREDRTQATYVVEARSGGIGTDRYQLLVGVPEMNLPSLAPGQPTLIPEIPLAKRTDQKGVAKLAVFAYNRRTGRPVWQSGVVRMVSASKDTWVCGAGPFRSGTLDEGTEFAGQPVSIPQIPLPLLTGKEPTKEAPSQVIAVTRAATWNEPPEPESWAIPSPAPQGLFRLLDWPTIGEQASGTPPLLRIGDSVLGDTFKREDGATSAPTEPDPQPRQPAVTNRPPGEDLDGLPQSTKGASGTEASATSQKDPSTRRGTNPSAAGGDRHN
jgi:hypothetical protein